VQEFDRHWKQSIRRVSINTSVGEYSLIGASLIRASGDFIGATIIVFFLVLSFILGPVIGLIGGLLLGQQQGRTAESYLAGVVGSVIGFVAMMLIIIFALSIGLESVSEGGDLSLPSWSEDVLQLSQYLIGGGIATAITCLGGVFFTDPLTPEQVKKIKTARPLRQVINTQMGPSRKQIISLIFVAVAVIIAWQVIIPVIQPPQSLQITVENVDENQYKVMVNDKVKNPTDDEITATITVELIIEGSLESTIKKELTLEPGEEKRILDQDEVKLYQPEHDMETVNYKLRYTINGKVVKEWSSS
jgi:hypothetical protein